MTVLLFLIVLVALGGLGYLGFKLFMLEGKHEKAEEKIRKYAEYTEKLEADKKRLAQYEDIAAASDSAADVRRTTDREMDEARQKAAATVDEAELEAKAATGRAQQDARAIITEAKEQARELRDDAKSQLDSATAQVRKIIEGANDRAEEIAGKAYDAVKNADMYEKAAEAMRHLVEGYGNKYIVPSHSMLDDLAEEFGHEEAGRELKNAREQSKTMIDNRTAAACDYVEIHRKKTAVCFVIDAFNGKVDSILSRVETDNAGTLEQEIRDALNVVNYNGHVFRNARITDDYLESRLRELKWAAVVQELKRQEREE